MEAHLHFSLPARRRGLALALVALLAALATVLLLARSHDPAIADNNPNNYDCRGHVEKGDLAELYRGAACLVFPSRTD